MSIITSVDVAVSRADHLITVRGGEYTIEAAQLLADELNRLITEYNKERESDADQAKE